GTVKDALDALASHPIDVALVDFHLGEETCAGFLVGARQSGFHAPIVVLTVGITDSQMAQVLADGAVGLVLKTSAPGSLFECIRQVFEGGSWMDQPFLRSLARLNSIAEQ